MKHNIPDRSENFKIRGAVYSAAVNSVAVNSESRAVTHRGAAIARLGYTSLSREYIKRQYRPPSPSGDKKSRNGNCVPAYGQMFWLL